MKKSIPSTKVQAIIIAIIGVVTISLVLLADCSPTSLRINTQIEKPSFTMKMPKSFYEDDEGDFIYSGDDFFYVTFGYSENEIMLTTECFALLYEASFYENDDFLPWQKIDINGTEALQTEYFAESAGSDDTLNYYAGVVTIFPLGSEFLIVDAYEYLGEANMDYSPVSDKTIKLFKDITSTIQITNTEYDNKVTEEKELYAAKLQLKLSSNWDLEENTTYGFLDYGYFVSYRFRKVKLWVNIYEYNDENAIDLHDVLESRTKDSTYTSMGEGFIAGERALLFSYDAYSESGSPPYLYGAVAISEHYAVDMHFNLYTNEYKLPYDTARKMLNLILEVEYK